MRHSGEVTGDIVTSCENNSYLHIAVLYLRG